MHIIIVLIKFFIQLVAVACVNISLGIDLSDYRTARFAMKGLYCKPGDQGDVKFVSQETVRVHDHAFVFSDACIYLTYPQFIGDICYKQFVLIA